MAFCKFCGKEISEGEVCDCQASQNSTTVNEEAAPVGTEPAAVAETAASESTRKTGMIILGAIAALVIIFIIAIVSSIAGGGYKKPVKNFEKALNKADGELLMETIMPKAALKELDDDDYDDMVESIEYMLNYMLEDAEDEYGKNVKFSISIEDKDKLKKSDIKELEEDYEYYDADVEITKGYELDVEVKIKGKDDKDTEDTTITVVKIKGEGWKLSTDSLFGF